MLAREERGPVTRLQRRRVARDRRAFERIWRVVTRVPRGRVVTYGQIARMAGFPNGARTVGWAMRALPDDLRIGGREGALGRRLKAPGGVRLWGGGARGGAAPPVGRAGVGG